MKINKDLEKTINEVFKNHIATFKETEDVTILDFKAPNTNEYRIRFLFEKEFYLQDIIDILKNAKSHRNYSAFDTCCTDAEQEEFVKYEFLYDFRSFDCEKHNVLIALPDDAVEKLKELVYVDDYTLAQIGKKRTDILVWYLKAFELAYNQLRKRNDIYTNPKIAKALISDLYTYLEQTTLNQWSEVEKSAIQDNLAKRLDNFAYDFDTYHYNDCLDTTREYEVERIKNDLNQGNVKLYIDSVSDWATEIHQNIKEESNK